MTEAINPYQVESSDFVAKQFDRVAARYDQHDAVMQQVADRLLSRLDYLAVQPSVVLDLGCGTGRVLVRLKQCFKKAQIIGVDCSQGMLTAASRRLGWWRRPRLIPADAHNLPLASDSVDLIVSNLMLPWCQDPHQVFHEMHRVLKPGGAVLFSSCGPDTVIEYRKRIPSNDRAVHAFGLIDMHDLGDSMLSTGFSAPVLDRENIDVTYPSVAAFEEELRALGAANLAIGRRRGLIGTDLRKAIRRGLPRSERFHVTLELVQGHAWKAEQTDSATEAGGDFVISLDRVRQQMKQGKKP